MLNTKYYLIVGRGVGWVVGRGCQMVNRRIQLYSYPHERSITYISAMGYIDNIYDLCIYIVYTIYIYYIYSLYGLFS